MRLFLLAALGSLAALAGPLCPADGAEKKPIKPTMSWTGSVDDEALLKGMPTVIVNAKDLEKVWKAWKVKGDVPKVDFAKEIVVITTAGGSRVNMSCVLDGDNLQVLGVATSDLVPGFRYVIATVPREGIKKVDGKDLPRE
jgi:hypothetical protein